jgi:hypothetical protein
MCADNGDRFVAVSLLHGLKQPQMLVVRLRAARRVVEAVGPPFQNNALEDLSQCLGQSLVPGKTRDFEMKVLIVD